MKNLKLYLLIFVPLLLGLVVLNSIVFASTNGASSTSNSNSTTSTTSTDSTTGQYFIYANVTGPNGEVNGEATKLNVQNTIPVLSYSQYISETTSNYAGSGMATGSFTYGVFKMSVAVSKASPVLLDMLIKNTALKTVEFYFYRPDTTSATGITLLVYYYKITLTNAHVVSYTSFGNSNGNFETYSFNFQSITWHDILHGFETVATVS